MYVCISSVSKEYVQVVNDLVKGCSDYFCSGLQLLFLCCCFFLIVLTLKMRKCGKIVIVS